MAVIGARRVTRNVARGPTRWQTGPGWSRCAATTPTSGTCGRSSCWRDAYDVTRAGDGVEPPRDSAGSALRRPGRDAARRAARPAAPPGAAAYVLGERYLGLERSPARRGDRARGRDRDLVQRAGGRAEGASSASGSCSPCGRRCRGATRTAGRASARYRAQVLPARRPVSGRDRAGARCLLLEGVPGGAHRGVRAGRGPRALRRRRRAERAAGRARVLCPRGGWCGRRATRTCCARRRAALRRRRARPTCGGRRRRRARGRASCGATREELASAAASSSASTVPYDEMPALYASALRARRSPRCPRKAWEEQFGMVLVEAMASRHAGGGVRDAARSPRCSAAPGRSCEPGDWAGIARGAARRAARRRAARAGPARCRPLLGRRSREHGRERLRRCACWARRRRVLRRATKPAGYYQAEPRGLVAVLPRPIGRVLDVGCGAGGVGASACAPRARAEIWGIEIIARGGASRRATRSTSCSWAPSRRRSAEAALRGPFDTICLLRRAGAPRRPGARSCAACASSPRRAPSCTSRSRTRATSRCSWTCSSAGRSATPSTATAT